MTKTKVTVYNNGSLKVDEDFENVKTQGNVYGLQGRTVISVSRFENPTNEPFINAFTQDYYAIEASKNLNARSTDIRQKEKMKYDKEDGF